MEAATQAGAVKLGTTKAADVCAPDSLWSTASHAATTKSAGNMSAAESSAEMGASESAAATMTTTTMAGGQGIRSHCNTERHGGDDEYGLSCGGLVLDVLNEGHRVFSAGSG